MHPHSRAYLDSETYHYHDRSEAKRRDTVQYVSRYDIIATDYYYTVTLN